MKCNTLQKSTQIKCAKQNECLESSGNCANSNNRTISSTWKSPPRLIPGKYSPSRNNYPKLKHLRFVSPPAFLYNFENYSMCSLVSGLFCKFVKLVNICLCFLKKYGTLHKFACHPCEGVMLIFSVIPILIHVLPK